MADDIDTDRKTPFEKWRGQSGNKGENGLGYSTNPEPIGKAERR